MRRRGPAAAAVLAAVAVAGCGGGDDDTPAEAAFPTTAAVDGDVLTATTTDAQGDVADPAADLRSGSVAQRGTTLEVRLVLARPPARSPSGTEPLHVGAYLLRDADDAEPFAARAVLERARAPAYRWGPWLDRGAAATGSVRGADVAIVVRGVPPGRYRYVQFFAESERGTDVAPEDTADAAGVVAMDPAGR